MKVRYFGRAVFQAETGTATGGTTTTQTGGTAGGTAGTTQTGTQTDGATTTTQQQTQQDATGKQAGTTEQTTGAEWRKLVTDPDALKEAERTTDLNMAFKRIAELRGNLSKSIVKPGEKATDEEKAAYRKAIGVPDAPDGYKFPDLPAGMELTDEIKADRARWAKHFHDRNIPAADAEALTRTLMEEGIAREKSQAEADKKYAAESMAALEKKWGADAPVNKTLGERALTSLADKAGVDVSALRSIETKAGTFLLDHPDIVQIFAVAGREMDEGSLGPVVDDNQRAAIDSQLRDVRAGIEKAQANRDSKEANRLYQQEQALLSKMNGARPIVGSQGRAA